MSFCPHCDETHDDEVDFCPRTGLPIVNITDRMIGRTIKRKYKLLNCIGQGGMGAIFEAEHLLMGTKVAVKLLHEAYSERHEPVQRLHREARACGSIGHPNIIKIFDVDATDSGVPFLVMELLKGESLGDHIEKEGPRNLGFVLDASIQILSALSAAHEAGIIHRDLKSDNIFLIKTDDDSIEIKVLDFGISKFIYKAEDNLRLTQTGSVLGTPYYMSPEQASGKKDLDLRIDIYAVGVMIYEMLLGTIPHSASNYNALLIEIISDEVKPFRWRRGDISEELEQVVLKALYRNRNKRWTSAIEFMNALTNIRDNLSFEVLSGDPVITKRLSPVERDSVTMDLANLSFDIVSDIPEASEISIRSKFKQFVKSASTKIMLLIAGSFIFLMLIALVFILLIMDIADSKTEDNVTDLLEIENKDNLTLEKEKQDLPIAEEKTVRISVTVTPLDSIVLVDEKIAEHGKIDIKNDNYAVNITVSKEGYVSETKSVIPNMDLDIVVKLNKVIQQGDLNSVSTKLQQKKKLIKHRGTNRKKRSNKKVHKSRVKKTENKGYLDQPMDNPF